MDYRAPRSGETEGRVGDTAGWDLDKPEWVCVEPGSPGRWVRVSTPEGRALLGLPPVEPDTFWKDITAAADGEPIEAVLIGGFGWGDEDADDSRAVGAENLNRLLTSAEAEPLLSYEYDTGYGGADCHEVFAWTANRVILVHEYDGSTGVRWVPRNPAVTAVAMGGLDVDLLR